MQLISNFVKLFVQVLVCFFELANPGHTVLHHVDLFLVFGYLFFMFYRHTDQSLFQVFDKAVRLFLFDDAHHLHFGIEARQLQLACLLLEVFHSFRLVVQILQYGLSLDFQL